MITITSTEKERIEGQMKTALPYLNDQIDFVVSIEQNEKARTTMTFKKDDVIYQLPMFYVAPSTDDSAWKELAEQIKEEVLDGILVINFKSDAHSIQNANTCILMKTDLFDKKALAEIERLGNDFNFARYKVHLFDATEITRAFEKLGKNNKTAEEISESFMGKVMEAVLNEPQVDEKEVTETKKKEMKDEAVIKPVKETEKKTEVKEDPDLESDIRALINDCFGIF